MINSIIFKTLIILYARSFWVTECTPNPGRSFQHWLVPMEKITSLLQSLNHHPFQRKETTDLPSCDGKNVMTVILFQANVALQIFFI